MRCVGSRQCCGRCGLGRKATGQSRALAGPPCTDFHCNLSWVLFPPNAPEFLLTHELAKCFRHRCSPRYAEFGVGAEADSRPRAVQSRDVLSRGRSWFLRHSTCVCQESLPHVE